MKLHCLIVLAAGCGALLAQLPPEATPVRDQHEAQLAAIAQDLERRSASALEAYLQTLDGVQKQIAAGGNLDAALAVKAERERAKAGMPLDAAGRKALPPVVQTELARFEQAIAPLVQARTAAEKKAREQYVAALGRLQQQLTAANELEKALAVRKEREQLGASTGPTSPAGATATNAPAASGFQQAGYFERLGKSLRAPKKTARVGKGKEGTEFVAAPEESAHLVGIAVKQGDWFGTPMISALQPIFESRNGRSRGKVHGKGAELPVVFEAKPGYVVSEMMVSAPSGHVHGVKLTFHKIDYLRQTLDAKDSYSSEWVGVEFKGHSERVGDPAKPAIGLSGRAGDWVISLGLLQAQ